MDSALDDKLLQSECLTASACADLLHKRLLPIMRASTAAEKAYAFKDRVKPWYAVRHVAPRRDLTPAAGPRQEIA